MLNVLLMSLATLCLRTPSASLSTSLGLTSPSSQASEQTIRKFKSYMAEVKLAKTPLADSGLSIEIPHLLTFGEEKTGRIPLGSVSRGISSISFNTSESPLAFPLKYPYTVGGVVLQFDARVGDNKSLVLEMARMYAQNLKATLSQQDTVQRQVTLSFPKENDWNQVKVPGVTFATILSGVVNEHATVDGISTDLKNEAAIFVAGKGKVIVACYYLNSYQWVVPNKLASSLRELRNKANFEDFLVVQSMLSLK